jgi:TonB family protein
MRRALRSLIFSLLFLTMPLYAQFQQTSPGKAIEEAARTAPTPPPQQKPPTPTTATVLNDTRGYDPAPYLEAAVFPRVRQQWYSAIPEFVANPNARNGDVIIEFQILRNGEVQALRVTKSSGAQDMDEAAFQGVMRASPLRALPKAMPPDHLDMRVHFYYFGKKGSKWWKQR